MSFVRVIHGIKNRNHPNSDVNVLMDSCPSPFVSFMKESHYFGDIQFCEGCVIANHIVVFSLLWNVGNRNSTIDIGFFLNGVIVDITLSAT